MAFGFDIVSTFLTDYLPVTRMSAGVFVDGIFIKGSSIDFDVDDVDETANTLTITAHGLTDEQGPVYLTTDGALPEELSTDTPYWVIVIDDDTIKLSETQGGSAIDITDPGSGTITLTNTFLIPACVQPAAGLQRVVGGRDMLSKVDGEHVDDVRVIYTATELFTRTPDYEADEITLEGSQWVVFRVEKWFLITEANTHYKVVITRLVSGAS